MDPQRRVTKVTGTSEIARYLTVWARS